MIRLFFPLLPTPLRAHTPTTSPFKAFIPRSFLAPTPFFPAPAPTPPLPTPHASLPTHLGFELETRSSLHQRLSSRRTLGSTPSLVVDP